MNVTLSLSLLLAYAAGSICSAIPLAKAMGLPSPREHGSNNPGATNMYRIGGKKAAALTLFFDALKGLLPVVLARLLDIEDTYLGGVAFAAVLGHCFPCWYGFRGGKGVATALGAMLGLSWVLALCVVASWLLIAKVFRLSSLAAIIASLLAPLFAYVAAPLLWWAVLSISALVVSRHHENIRRLIAGTEH